MSTPSNTTSTSPASTASVASGSGLMCKLYSVLIGWPERVAAHLLWLGPLVARVIVGYVFMLTGWAKLNNLPHMIELFTDWGIPFPQVMTPVASGIECFGGLALILGLCTRVAGGALAVVMIVAVLSVKLVDVDSVETLFGFEETAYFAIFFWLSIHGAGKISIDAWLRKHANK